jgi:uncharacterized protein YfkK (UPF0435 family)
MRKHSPSEINKLKTELGKCLSITEKRLEYYKDKKMKWDIENTTTQINFIKSELEIVNKGVW